eukprot:CAMPEP_0202083370 /NCGR_PEP_ID=MMETSP0964-20121228/23465_1 /ASSEMBLY_ACC=CAM_ASM_000500 /TAXON_ID=4773 /ORGANISM="Schizochytrium aggregatum, Strain ATCC28209" /LENGTH=247 /DNA_ID=CAMNT_0048651077 /DNA_START=86 /DNA_END=829 /DNA_ORIENTATION=-
MGFVTLLGVAVFAFGPPLALLFSVVARRAQLVLVTVTSAFFELLALIFTGLLFFLIPVLAEMPLLTAAFGVAIQEASRFGYLSIYVKSDDRVEAMCSASDRTPFSDFASAVAAGLGFALMNSLIMYGGVLQAALQPGDLYTDACPRVSLFVLSALLALMFQALNMALMVLGLDALRRPSGSMDRRVRIVLVVCAHFVATFLGALNDNAEAGGCATGITLQALVVTLVVAETVRTVRSKSYAMLSHGR